MLGYASDGPSAALVFDAARAICEMQLNGRTDWQASGGLDAFGRRVRRSNAALRRTRKRVLPPLESKIRDGDTGERKKITSARVLIRPGKLVRSVPASRLTGYWTFTQCAWKVCFTTP